MKKIVTVLIFVSSVLLFIGCSSGSKVSLTGMSLTGYWGENDGDVFYIEQNGDSLKLYFTNSYLDKNGVIDFYTGTMDEENDSVVLTYEYEDQLENETLPNGKTLNGTYKIYSELLFLYTDDTPSTLVNEKSLTLKKVDLFVVIDNQREFWKSENPGEENQRVLFHTAKPKNILEFTPNTTLTCIFTEESGVPVGSLKTEVTYRINIEAIPNEMFPSCSKEATVSFISENEVVSFPVIGKEGNYMEAADRFELITSPLGVWWSGEWGSAILLSQSRQVLGTVSWENENNVMKSVSVKTVDYTCLEGRYGVTPEGTVNLHNLWVSPDIYFEIPQIDFTFDSESDSYSQITCDDISLSIVGDNESFNITATLCNTPQNRYAEDADLEFNILYGDESFYATAVLTANYLPNAPVAMYPKENEIVKENTFYSRWTESLDPKGGLVTYRINYAQSIEELSESQSFFETSGTYFLFPSLSDGIWYWQVTAINNMGYEAESQVWGFSVVTGN